MTEKQIDLEPDYKEIFRKNYLVKKSQKQEKPTQSHLDLITFSLDKETYGIELTSLQEILKAESIWRVPKSPKYLAGILNLRGRILTVVNLRERLGFADSLVTHAKRVLILQEEGRSLGFLVDKTQALVKIPKDSLTPPSDSIPEEKRYFIHSIINHDQGLIVLLDHKKLFET